MANTNIPAGGTATTSGIDFQLSVAAWYCVCVLAEKSAAPPLDLSADLTLELVRLETGEPVDDLLIETSERGFIFAQVKHSLDLGTTDKSELASVVDQFVRQYLANRAQTNPARSWNRPLDARRDRLVVIVGPGATGTIRTHLRAVLEKVRGLPRNVPVSDAPTNADERHALTTFLSHVDKSWRTADSTVPNDDDVRTLLQLIRVQVLDLDAGGTSETEARERLRTAVLKDPAKDKAAWGDVVHRCGQLASRRSAADRPALQQFLLDLDYELRAPISYSSDIELLQKHSTTNVELIEDLSILKVKGKTVKITRRCQAALEEHSQTAPLLITGAPGAGKSGLLHDLALGAPERNERIVLLVDRLSATSLGGLRDELGLTHDLVDVLRQWPSKKAMLIIDALDAARVEKTAAVIRDVIRLVLQAPTRWNIVASIRKFDLRYGETLKKLFEGSPPSDYKDAEFRNVRHINVEQLDDDELGQIAAQSPELASLLQHAPKVLRELLRVSFNVRLVADLLSSGVEAAEISPIRTQLELLDRYWKARVLGDDAAGDMREAVLRSMCERMVDLKRLQVARSTVPPDQGRELTDLLSAHVLAEWRSPSARTPDRYTIHFYHHVLFDYAVARLLLRGPVDVVVARLVGDPEFPLVARPSLSLQLEHLWANDREQFWALAFALLGANTSKIIRLVAPGVAAVELETAHDLLPMLERLALDDGDEQRHAAEEFFEQLLGAIIADAVPVLGATVQPWAEVAASVAARLTRRSAFGLRTLIVVALDGFAAATPDQLRSLGEAARALLTFAWDETIPQIVPVALQSVCRTIKTDRPASNALLRKAIDPVRIKSFGYAELPWIAQEIAYVVDQDPELARDVYTAAFGHDEPSEEVTKMGSSSILRLASNRRQDYEMALWQLAEQFPHFLNAAVFHATSALLAAICAYDRRWYGSAESAVISEEFELAGKPTRLVTDHSGIWDSGNGSSHDDPLRMLDAFDERVQRVTAGEIADVLSAIAGTNVPAALIRRLLQISISSSVVAEAVTPLLSIPAVLACVDTSVEAGDLLKKIYSSLESSTRERIENAILGLTQGIKEYQREPIEYIQARLLGCLDEAHIVNGATLELIAAYRAQNDLPDNQTERGLPPVTIKPFSFRDHIARQGARVDNPVNREILDLGEQVAKEVEPFANTAPSIDQLTAILIKIRALRNAVRRSAEQALDERIRDHAWSEIALAARRLSTTRLPCTDPRSVEIQDLLLQASEGADPEPSEAQNSQFDQSPGWGSPAARIDAAIGLMGLVSQPECVRPAIIDAIRRLACDPVAAVRFQIAVEVLSFFDTARDLMWTLIEQFADRDPSRGVVRGVVTQALGQLVALDSDRVIEQLRLIRRRFPDANAGDLWHVINALLVQIYVYTGHEGAAHEIRTLVTEVPTSPDHAGRLCPPLRSALTHGDNELKDVAIRRRAFGVFRDLLAAAQTALAALQELHVSESNNEWSDEEKKLAAGYGQIISEVCTELFFGSGAYEMTKQRKEGEALKPLSAESRRFYAESKLLLDEIAKVALPAASHYVIETLEVFSDLDPRGVFLRMADVVRQSRAYGYQRESLALDLVVRIVERYLAEYRHLFADDKELREALMAVLDIFVEAGWPAARRLAYKLDEIFR